MKKGGQLKNSHPNSDTQVSNTGETMSDADYKSFKDNADRSLFLRDLPFHCRDEHLNSLANDLLESTDCVELCHVKYSGSTDKTLQVGIIMLKTVDLANTLLSKLRMNPRFCGRDIRVSLFNPRAFTEQSHDGAVNLSFDMIGKQPLVTEALIREHLEALYGTLSSVCIRGHYYNDDGQSGFGFITFVDDALNAKVIAARKDFVESHNMTYQYKSIRNQNNQNDSGKYSTSSQSSAATTEQIPQEQQNVTHIQQGQSMRNLNSKFGMYAATQRGPKRMNNTTANNNSPPPPSLTPQQPPNRSMMMTYHDDPTAMYASQASPHVRQYHLSGATTAPAGAVEPSILVLHPVPAQAVQHGHGSFTPRSDVQDASGMISGSNSTSYYQNSYSSNNYSNDSQTAYLDTQDVSRNPAQQYQWVSVPYLVSQSPYPPPYSPLPSPQYYQPSPSPQPPYQPQHQYQPYQPPSPAHHVYSSQLPWQQPTSQPNPSYPSYPPPPLPSPQHLHHHPSAGYFPTTNTPLSTPHVPPAPPYAPPFPPVVTAPPPLSSALPGAQLPPPLQIPSTPPSIHYSNTSNYLYNHNYSAHPFQPPQQQQQQQQQQGLPIAQYRQQQMSPSPQYPSNNHLYNDGVNANNSSYTSTSHKDYSPHYELQQQGSSSQQHRPHAEDDYTTNNNHEVSK